MITTATIWVCSNCGVVSHVDGGNEPSYVTHGYCRSYPTSEPNPLRRHTLKPVLVVVPYA